MFGSDLKCEDFEDLDSITCQNKTDDEISRINWSMAHPGNLLLMGF